MKPVDLCILTVIRPELDAARAVLGLSATPTETLDNGTIVVRGALRSELRGCEYPLVLACIGGAGNPGAAAVASTLLERFKPKYLVLMGIGAGMRRKVRIGQVIIPERIVAYEQAALVQAKDGTRIEQPRTDIPLRKYPLRQVLAHYAPSLERIRATFERIGGQFPQPPPDKQLEWQEQVASEIMVSYDSSLASGEKLLRDPNKLEEVQGQIHGKVDSGDMESMGIAEACEVHDVPWIVFRGISDFGDGFKDDRFHGFASRTAAAVMADFLANALDLGGRPEGSAPARSNSFLPGGVVEREQDFLGRQREQAQILEALGRWLPVQLLGGARMGKSSLLRWVERHSPLGHPVVRVNAGSVLSPVAPVRAIASQLKQERVSEALEGRRGTVLVAAEQLEQLPPFLLLVDDADILARSGKGYDEGFFEALRAQVESEKMGWVSTSRSNLYDLFKQEGLTSRFLNSTEKVWVGPLDEEAARRLAERAPAEHVERILQAAGGFAHGLHWLGDQLLRKAAGAVNVYAEFEQEMGPHMQQWWESLSPEEQALLRSCARQEVQREQVDAKAGSRLDHLVTRGYLTIEGGSYRLAPGEVWGRFVRDAR